MTPETEAELHTTLGRLLADSQTSREAIHQIGQLLFQVKTTVDGMSAFPAELSDLKRKVSVLQSWKDRSIGRSTVIAGIAGIAGAISGFVVELFKAH